MITEKKGKVYGRDLPDEEEKKEEKLDLKLPFDMKSFWKNINEKYFRKYDQFSQNEVNHLVHSYSKYGRNNPLGLTKFFGMYLYVDKFDYCINNLNNEDIEEEAEAIEEKLKGIEENSILFYKNIKNKIKKEETQIYTLIGKTIDLNSSEVIQNRFDNLANQIFTLQMKQFSESIWNIKKDLKNNTYIIGFDSNENIECITLNHSQYKELLKFRDPLNSVSVYDLFQEKIFSYYNGSTGTGKVERGRGVPSPIGKEITIIEKKKRGRKPKKKLLLVPDDQSTYIPDEALPESDSPIKKKRGRKKKVEIKRAHGRKQKLISLNKPNEKIKNRPVKEEVEIAKVVNINYDFCHHCKQRKPAEVMVKCCSSSCSKFVERPVKNFLINNTTCVRKFKNFIITNFSGDPKDILDGYLNKKVPQSCNRYFCNFCLKGSYDQIIEQIKDKKDWICPWCLGNCFCSRCIRYDQILKLISLYISHKGDINILYDNLISKSVVLDKLSVNLMISNIIILKNDPVSKSQKVIKSYFGERDYEAIDKIIDQGYQFRDHLSKVKDYFDYAFQKARHEKVLFHINEKKNSLGKKKRREEYKMPALMQENTKLYNKDLYMMDLGNDTKKVKNPGFRLNSKGRPNGKYTRLKRSLE